MKTILKMIMIGGAFALQAQTPEENMMGGIVGREVQKLEENNIDSRIKSLYKQLQTAWGFENVFDTQKRVLIFFKGDWHAVSVNKKALEARDELFSLAHSGTLSENQMNAVLDALEMGLTNPFQWGNDYYDGKPEAIFQFRASIFRRLGYLAIDPFVPMTIANQDKLIELLSAPLYDERTPRRQYKKEDGTIGVSVPRNFQLLNPSDSIFKSYFSIDPLRKAAMESLEKIAQSELPFSREKIEPLMKRAKELMIKHQGKALSLFSGFRSTENNRQHKINASHYRNILYHFQKLEAQWKKTHGNETVSPKTKVVPQPELEESTNLLE